MKVLIVGLGSIAKKHIISINKIEKKSHIFALRSGKTQNDVEGVINIYHFSDIPESIDFAIISNPTNEHYLTISNLVSLCIPLFIEKPVLNSLEGYENLLQKLLESKTTTYVACNLRFHPAINHLKLEIEKRLPLELNVYCGSYLPHWRLDGNYRLSYSADKERGGGVHLDLIHEIDYCYYLLGLPNSSHSYVRKKSNLDINSADIAHYILEYDRTSVFITLNYYRKSNKRTIECIWENEIWYVDLIANMITDQNGLEIFKAPYSIQDTYNLQMMYFTDCLFKKSKPMNSFSDAIEVLKICLNE